MSEAGGVHIGSALNINSLYLISRRATVIGYTLDPFLPREMCLLEDDGGEVVIVADCSSSIC